MMPLFKLVLPGCVFLHLLVSGCSRGENLSGATSETTNGQLSALVKASDGSPAPGVSVLLIDNENWIQNLDQPDSQLIDSAVTDGEGKFDISIPLGRRSNLQFVSLEGNVFRDAQNLFTEGNSVVSRQFNLKPLFSLSGKVQPDGNVPAVLRMAGTVCLSGVGADSSYVFNEVPPGVFDIVASENNITGMPVQAGTVDLSEGAGVVDQILPLRWNAVLLDDFEFGWGQSALGRLTGDGWWYEHQDNQVGGNSSVEVSVIEGPASYRGKCIRATYILDSAISQPWSIVGLQFGADPVQDVFDMSSLASIDFRARGSGQVSVKLLSRLITDDYSNWYQFYFNVALDSNWRHIRIPVDSLRIPERAPEALKLVTWAQAAAEIHTIDFTVESPESSPGDTVLMWLDDIYLDGMGLPDFYREE